MNISLSKGKKKLGFGLNSRKQQESSASAPTNVFGQDSSDEDDDDNNDDARAEVNRTLRREQEALRKRAAASLEEAEVYDYDGAYDDMHASAQNQKQQEPQEKKSRYIGDLLKAAKQRERERDVIHERKVAKEQAQEEAEYQGKDKFVTKAYKQKLEERELWLKEEEAKRREEEEQDVTKKKVDGAFSSFYGNLNRNVAMGGSGDRHAKKESPIEQEGASRVNEEHEPPSEKPAPAGLGFLDGFERSEPDNDGSAHADFSKNEAAVAKAMSPISMRKAREEKLAKARLRYFQRQGITEEGARNQKQ